MNQPSKFEKEAIASEQLQAYHKGAGALNMAGALVFTLLVIVVQDRVPVWTWAPVLLVLYLNTVYRHFLFRRYLADPRSRSPAQWIKLQTAASILSGLCWGLGNAAMMAYLDNTYQLFILAVAGVVAASSVTEGFTVAEPSRTFIVASLSPIILLLIAIADALHLVLAVMLLVLILVSLILSKRTHAIFFNMQLLRLQKEFLAEELATRHQQLEQANVSKSRFLAAASHDLRQPLAALMLFLEQLEREQQISSEGKRLVQLSHHATTSLQELLNSLLDISRLESQSIQPELRALPIQNLFDRLDQEFQPLAGEKGLRLVFVPNSAMVWSDPVILSQILRNLISNAIRYTPKGRILIGARRRQGNLRIETHDTGIGIAEPHLKKIFEEFYQIDNQERDRQKGLGLGLSIVNRAARLLKHPVHVRSIPGKGSVFTVTLPLSPASAADAPLSSTGKFRSFSIKGLNIALIENEGDIRIGLQRLMESEGAYVLVANSVEAMLSQIAQDSSRLDLVISDYGLAGKHNGIDTITLLRRQLAYPLPALLFTGDIRDETRRAAQAAGLEIVYKPASSETLLSAIAKTIAR